MTGLHPAALLLAFAIASKIFPGLLLVHLAARRQWRAIAMTVAMLAAMTVVSAIVLGIGPLGAFLSHQLPRMASGEAFAYTEQNFDNHALYGLAFKLAALGVVGDARALGSTLGWAWTLAIVALAIVGLRAVPRIGQRDAVLWLGIVCLATLRSPFAPAYTAVGTLWLLSDRHRCARLVEDAGRGRVVVLTRHHAPLFGPASSALVSFPSQAISIAVAVLAVWPRRR